MNYYSHHLGDYDGATAHLTWDEDQAYTRLLRVYYRLEKPIPIDQREACRLARAGTKGQKDAVARVLTEFFEQQDDGWHNKRADEEINAYHAKSDKARNASAVRWHQSSNASALRPHSEGNANHKPITNNQEPVTKKEAAAVGIQASGRFADETPAAPANGKAVAYIPLNDGSQFAVSTAYAAELERLYPKVDVKQTLNEIRGYNLANEGKRKAPEEIKHHIDSWMRREHNGGTAKA